MFLYLKPGKTKDNKSVDEHLLGPKTLLYKLSYCDSQAPPIAHQSACIKFYTNERMICYLTGK